GIDVQAHVTAARFESRNASHGLDDAGEHQHTSRGEMASETETMTGMKRSPRRKARTPQGMRQTHGIAAIRLAVFFHPDCGPHRRTGTTWTVGSGIGPDLLTSRCCRERSRARSEEPTAGGEFRPALKTFADEPAAGF